MSRDLFPSVDAGEPRARIVAYDGSEFIVGTGEAIKAGTNITFTKENGYIRIDGDAGTGAPSDADYLVGTSNGGLSAEIVVGTTPGGELGGTWPSPTVDATHSGSSHAGVIATHEAAADPHTGYRREDQDHTHATTGLQGGQLDHGAALTGLSDDDHPQYLLRSLVDAKGDLLVATADNTLARLAVGLDGTVLIADSAQTEGVRWRSRSGTASLADVAASESAGSDTTIPNGDHVHRLGIGTTRGDVIVWNSSAQPARVALGAAGTVLRSDGSDLDYAKIKYNKHITIENPVDADIIRWFINSEAITITNVYTNLVGGTSVVINIVHGTNPASGANLWSSGQTANTLTSIQTHSTTYNDATVAALEGVSVDVGTVTGSVTQLHITIEYTKDSAP